MQKLIFVEAIIILGIIKFFKLLIIVYVCSIMYVVCVIVEKLEFFPNHTLKATFLEIRSEEMISMNFPPKFEFLNSYFA